MFNYGILTWTAGNASGGDPKTGLHTYTGYGVAAQVSSRLL